MTKIYPVKKRVCRTPELTHRRLTGQAMQIPAIKTLQKNRTCYNRNEYMKNISRNK
jgi:hypothetical protein